ncbi:MAG: HAMP domain-containing sensor histidine kinase [Dehalococcoidia bacterium]|nr:HAMP domain-containing sensor histidine kinase [Dehalococcoidia bacterium]
MNGKIPPGLEIERTPEEETLVMRLGVFNNMRWVAILGVIAVTLIARYGFDIGFPTVPVYVVCVFMALYNLVLMQQVRALRKVRADRVIPRVRQYVYIHIVLDMFALIVLLHFTGGVENPFVFFFVFHVVLASIGLSYQVVYLLSTMAIIMVSFLFGLEYAGAIPHVNLEGFAEPAQYEDASYNLAVLTALGILLYGTAYLTTAIAGELRKRQRQVVALRDTLLQEKNGELERASTSIAKLQEEKARFLHFIGIAAHDLKAPLTAIQGFLWVMLGGFAGEISEKQRNMLERSTLRINELLTLISDLLDIPRIETGQIVQEMENVCLREIIDGSIEGQRNLAEAKGIDLIVDVPDELPAVKGSSSRLQQVFTNLINNAINYTQEGAVTVCARERQRDLLVEVVDTGIGIPPADMSHVFEDFFRASNVETRGTGLGLSICRRIVEAHGGKIWAESPCPGASGGSKFSFTLPKLTDAKGRRRR